MRPAFLLSKPQGWLTEAHDRKSSTSMLPRNGAGPASLCVVKGKANSFFLPTL